MPEPIPGTLPAAEAAAGWLRLFDGETIAGWSGPAKVQEGSLLLGDETNQVQVATRAAFGTFELTAEYRLEGGAGTFTVTHGGSKSVVSEAGDTSWQSFEFNQPEGSPADVITIVTQPGTRLALRRVHLRPLGLKPLFNGKDLTGWKEAKTARSRSKFSVTEEGELRIQDGPGDLQSEEQWADFVLQLDIYSNGHALNSGVFARCLPGEFWSGYEAQIRNEWATELRLHDGTELLGSLRERDDGKLALKLCTVEQGRVKLGSQTRELEKDQVAETRARRDLPIDFGTGGIYFHAPARRVVANDREWFTMTFAIRGDHLSVWVNGYLTAEWTDARPVQRSPRQGKKLTAGPISLQGHDPTTDLRFRHIRIAGLGE
ncbi:MAG TPA: DUF1080 domain-containing protein [Gemmatales bacterium]|nr:DUF1080 domain-containing protein [Gemmatales bacterium]HMP58826.1 DUF1080 domain-containing protein [Gemmatales bacterium]